MVFKKVYVSVLMYHRVALEPLSGGDANPANERFKAAIDCLHQQLEARIHEAIGDSSCSSCLAEEDPPTSEQEPESVLITRVSDAVRADSNLVTAVHFPLSAPPIVTTEQSSETDQEPSESDLRHALDELMTRRRRPPDHLLGPLTAYVKRLLADAILAEDYDTAEQLKEAESRLAEERPEDSTRAAEKKQRLRDVDGRITSMKQKIDEIKSRWAATIAALDSEKKMKLEEIKARHESEQDKFEEHWNTPTTVMAFSKPSPQLLQLRRLQKTSALTNDFQRAKELKLRADELEKEETKLAERKATASMQAAYKNLVDKQAKEIEFATMNWRRQLLMMQGERDAELEKANLCLRQLQIKKDECQTTRVRPLSCLSKPKKDPKAIATPRTRRQITDYKAATTQEKLQLMGFNVKDVIRTNRQGRRPLTSARRCVQ